MNAHSVQPCGILVFDEDAQRARTIEDFLSRSPRQASVCVLTSINDVFDLVHRINTHQQAPSFDISFLVFGNHSIRDVELVREIKSSPELQRAVLIVFTGSRQRLAEMYDAGVNATIMTPEDANELAETMEACRQFWLEVAQLPQDNPKPRRPVA